MHPIEDFLNSLADKDWGWWPLLSLRPLTDRNIDNATIFRLTCLFGPWSGMVGFLASLPWIAGRTSAAVITAHIVLGCLVFFALFKCTFARCWNRRAARLREQQASLTPVSDPRTELHFQAAALQNQGPAEFRAG